MVNKWGVKVISILIASMAIVNVLSAVVPALPERAALIADFSPLTLRRGGHLTSALAGFALLILSVNLWRHRRTAWIATLAVLGISAVSHMLKGLDYEETSLALVLAIFLWFLKPHFYSYSDPPSIKRGLYTLVYAFIFTLFYGIAGFFLLDKHFSVNFGLLAALRQTVVMFTEYYNPGLNPITGFGRYFADSIYMVSAAAFGYALLMIVRPVALRGIASEYEKQKAQEIVESFGRTTMARFTLFGDKHYFFSDGGSVIAFAVKNGCALALGDPIGPQEDLNTALFSFKEICQANSWTTAFYQVLPDHLDEYRSAGFDKVCIGFEGIVDLHTFTLEGNKNKSFRTALNKLTRIGHKFTVVEPPIADDLIHELRQISDEWLATMHSKEKRFSLGRFEDDYIRSSRIAVIYTDEDVPSAFAVIEPEYHKNETAIDLMRYRKDAEAGTMDFLFVSLFQWAKSQGFDTFNLGLSPFSGVGEEPGDPLLEKGMHFIYENVNQLYNFKGLHRFKDKFSPQWEPRYLIYPGAASLMRVAVGLLLATSGKAAATELE